MQLAGKFLWRCSWAGRSIPATAAGDCGTAGNSHPDDEKQRKHGYRSNRDARHEIEKDEVEAHQGIVAPGAGWREITQVTRVWKPA